MTDPVYLPSLLSLLPLKHTVLALLFSTAEAAKETDWYVKLQWLIHLTSAFSVIIPLIIGYRKRDRLERGLRLLLLNLFIALIVEVIALILLFTIEENFFIYTLFTPVEFILFAMMFRHWNAGRRMERFFAISIPVFMVVWLGGMIWASITTATADFTYWEMVKSRIWNFENILLSAESVYFIIGAIGTLFVWLRDEEHALLTNGMFWVTAAVLIYYSGNLFVFTFMTLILEIEVFKDAWYIHTALNILKNLLYALGLVYAGKAAVTAVRPTTSEH